MFGNMAYEFVAAVVAQHIAQFKKAFHVQIADQQAARCLRGSLRFVLEHVQQQHFVGRAGQGVVGGQKLQLLQQRLEWAVFSSTRCCSCSSKRVLNWLKSAAVRV